MMSRSHQIGGVRTVATRGKADSPASVVGKEPARCVSTRSDERKKRYTAGSHAWPTFPCAR